MHQIPFQPEMEEKSTKWVWKRKHLVQDIILIIIIITKDQIRTPKEEPKDYKTPKRPKGSKQDHQENKKEKNEYKLDWM